MSDVHYVNSYRYLCCSLMAVFRVSTFGESHCAGVGCIVDGVPPRMQLTEADIQVCTPLARFSLLGTSFPFPHSSF